MTDEMTTMERIQARMPRACPECGTDKIAPLFEGNWWDCERGHAWEAKN